MQLLRHNTVALRQSQLHFQGYCAKQFQAILSALTSYGTSKDDLRTSAAFSSVISDIDCLARPADDELA
eukprot:CAMPEP_0168412100 /NCGR_PEP_ID=MMETSP0228-20121227/28537_1 /TAXON_ID=133427 /ORGANISM="Protoceratium reticulatum, Strain CCCM 535 (=CCMP 1889)" /LENGTH=68 /DNA_ID=CAMNT_0008425857 /DNA_START=41 /DNA_END=243 /DNA_ORIENTATION=+